MRYKIGDRVYNSNKGVALENCIAAQANSLLAAHAPTIQMAPATSQICQYYSPDCLVQDFKNFNSSLAPARFLSFRDGSWTDFPQEVFDILMEGFLSGKAVLEGVVDGRSYIFDFLRMFQIDRSTVAHWSIAWIDVSGRCFFPRAAVAEQFDKSSPMAPPLEHIPLKRKRNSHSDESPESSSSTTSFDRQRWAGTEMLDKENKFYKVVEKLFLYGIKRFAPGTVTTSICRCLPAGDSAKSRLRAFHMHMQMMKGARGDANVRFGWYGVPAEAIAGVIAHGFGRPNNESLGPDAHGVGVHLSPPHSPHRSCMLSQPDGDGERHVLLCRAIMGKPERVAAGSLQYHPSSDGYDSGVDNFENPKWYVVWSTHMNTHIHPEYVVSFKASRQPQGQWRRTSPEKSLVRTLQN